MQQQVLTETFETDFATTASRYKTAKIFSQHQKLFSNGDIMKKCLIVFAESNSP